MLLCIKSWAAGMALIGVMELKCFESQIENAAEIAVGDSSEEVHEAIGEPHHDWDKFEHRFWNDRPHRWVYGTTISLRSIVLPELPFPNPVPINIRIFGAAAGDLVVAFDDDMEVISIRQPYTSSQPTE
jgi:hypothetical protein